jgi:hypothetical protein
MKTEEEAELRFIHTRHFERSLGHVFTGKPGIGADGKGEAERQRKRTRLAD